MVQIARKEFERLRLAQHGDVHEGSRPRWLLWILAGIAGLVVAVVIVLSGVVAGPRDFVVRAVPEEEAPVQEGEGDEIPLVSEVPVDAAEAPPSIYVHVDGAVIAPGVYGVSEGARVHEAVEAAGGLAPGADVGPINLAASVADGTKITIPFEGEELPVWADSLPTASAGGAGRININTAGAAELEGLPGIGPSLAAAIVEERERGGPFAVPEDLLRVSGIGEKKLARLIDVVTV